MSEVAIGAIVFGAIQLWNSLKIQRENMSKFTVTQMVLMDLSSSTWGAVIGGAIGYIAGGVG